ncbi:hypothetical protein A355_0111 [Candidatus Carsonella ruddii HT isolate Thao2000]|uniref:Uncharacterized protein n=1 Tax=Candidatus Carsonella ruddii HT isolate Thao2000 TaxID=1202539 RepID=J3TWB5_CARRU|nr:hypothetical protein [Candidatus Carsonella ruddii]AFP84140.1 hypothetical protein A355_0111 [Candidatus Carsonella ruddii HT isolate Thao2000]
MNFQIFKILFTIGSKIFNFNIIKVNINYFNDIIKTVKRIFFLKLIKTNYLMFFFLMCIKYILYGINFVYFFLIYYLKKYFFTNKAINFKKKIKLINIIKINNLILFKICYRIKKNMIKKYSLNLTRRIAEKLSFKKILKTILL